MLGKTHIAISSVMVPTIYEMMGHSIEESIPALIVGGILGSIAPDIDNQNSILGRYMPKKIIYKYGHRMLGHSIEMMVLLCVFLWSIIWFFHGPLDVLLNNPYNIIYAFGIAFYFHLIADLPTKDGVMFFWFYKKIWWFPDDETKRIKVGSIEERNMFRASIGVFAFYVLVGLVGGCQNIKYHINFKGYAAISVIKSEINEYEHIVKVKGKWTESNINYEQRAKVIGLNKQETDLILQDIDSGIIYSGYCRGETTIKSNAFLDEVVIVSKQKKRLRNKRYNKKNEYINSNIIPDNSYIKGEIILGRQKYIADEMDRYAVGDFKTIDIGRYGKGEYKAIFNYFSGEEFKKMLPMYVESAAIEVIYREKYE